MKFLGSVFHVIQVMYPKIDFLAARTAVTYPKQCMQEQTFQYLSQFNDDKWQNCCMLFLSKFLAFDQNPHDLLPDLHTLFDNKRPVITEMFSMLALGKQTVGLYDTATLLAFVKLLNKLGTP